MGAYKSFTGFLATVLMLLSLKSEEMRGVAMATNTTRQLVALRALMKDAPSQIHAYIIPSGDAHQSEYIAAHDARRAYMTGFTGSAGTAIVTQTQALLWTDGRYDLQAAQQLDNNWQLMKESVPTTPSREKWLLKNLSPRSTVGADPRLMSNAQWQTLVGPLHKAGHTLLPVAEDLVDRVWNSIDGGSRPPQPDKPIFALPIKYTGETLAQKLVKVREQMKEKEVSLLVISGLDEVAYLFNLRGSDIPYNPVFFAFACVTMDDVLLFTADSRLTADAREQLETERGGNQLHIRPYHQVITFIKETVSSGTSNSSVERPYSVWVPHSCSQALHLACGAEGLSKEANVVSEVSPVTLMKSVKNDVETQGLIACHVRDGVALARYFSWLEDQLVKKNITSITEISGADQLEKFRSELSDYMGLSFSTISSSGPNGAIIHYKPEPETDRPLSLQELYLCDSGAQFRDGTTDVTRTWHFGQPTQAQVDNFTRVLKGQIALGSAIFPGKVKGNVLDTLARQALWQVGLDYAHGTGHGVGAFLNVHEGPMGISYRPMADDNGLQPNMFLSNEPGYYADGEYGIRLEDIVRIVSILPAGDISNERRPFPHGLLDNFKQKGALGFQTVTMSPIQARLINTHMLTPKEITYIDAYHSEVWKQVSPLMQDPKMADALAWLQRNTQPLQAK